MAVIKHATLLRLNFRAKLPEDFDKVLAVYKHGWLYIDELHMAIARYGEDVIPNDTECYTIDMYANGHFIQFEGHYSSWWIIRKFQQLNDLYRPVKYKITYYSKPPTYRIYKDTYGSCTLLGEVYRDVTKEEYDNWNDKKQILYI